METCKHGSGRGGEKRTERQRARRLLHQKNGAIVRQVVGYDRLVGDTPIGNSANSTERCVSMSIAFSPR